MKHILVIDDDIHINDMLEKVLTQLLLFFR